MAAYLRPAHRLHPEVQRTVALRLKHRRHLNPSHRQLRADRRKTASLSCDLGRPHIPNLPRRKFLYDQMWTALQLVHPSPHSLTPCAGLAASPPVTPRIDCCSLKGGPTHRSLWGRLAPVPGGPLVRLLQALSLKRAPGTTPQLDGSPGITFPKHSVLPKLQCVPFCQAHRAAALSAPPNC